MRFLCETLVRGCSQTLPEAPQRLPDLPESLLPQIPRGSQSQASHHKPLPRLSQVARALGEACEGSLVRGCSQTLPEVPHGEAPIDSERLSEAGEKAVTRLSEEQILLRSFSNKRNPIEILFKKEIALEQEKSF